MNFKHLPYEQLSVEPGFNTRYDLGEIAELSESIIQNGLEIPIIVVPAPDGIKYFVRSGHRRFAAITMAYENADGHKEFGKLNFGFIPCEIRAEYDKEKQILDIVTHNSGKPLLPLEEAETYKRLREDCGWDDRRISKQTGKRRSYINGLLSLAYAGEQIKGLVKNNQLSAATAIQIISLYPEDEAAQLMEISGALDVAIESGHSIIRTQHVAKLKQKNPLVKFKMLQDKIAVEKIASKTGAVHPAIEEAVAYIGNLLADGTVQQTYLKLKSINPKQ